jgi:tetratricopeptide (TPR) repeat protein
MYKILYLLIPLLLCGCKSDAEMAMERGIQLYDWNKLDDAIIEFNKVKYLLADEDKKTLESMELLAQAHFNLGITYAKMNFYNQAEQEILNALSLIPNAEYRDVLKLIRNKIDNQSNN